MKYYKGDTLLFDYLIENYTLKMGDIIRIVIYKPTNKLNEYIIHDIEINEDVEKISVQINSDEMKSLKIGSYILEINLLKDNIRLTTLQEDLLIKESWCE